MDREKAYKQYAKLRDEKGVTDYQVAKATGVAFQTLQSWKNMEYCPKVDKIIKLANYFGVSIEYFLKEE